MVKSIIYLLALIGFAFAQEKTPEDVWKPFRYFEGSWTGEETGKAGIGKGERTIEFIMDSKYLFYQNSSRFEPQEKNPKGEIHQDWAFISFDHNREKYILREFHSEGFVNQYILDSFSSDEKKYTFVSENVENAPADLKARITLTILNKYKFKEIFELAFSGDEYSIWLENIWTKKINPDPERFRETIEMFRRFDRKNSLPGDAVLFVGSSSIVLWNTAKYFPGLPVINRGFGGSHISDVNYFIDTVVFPYQPKLILFYAGDNDVAAGKSVDQVFSDYIEFVKSVKEKLPHTHIIYLPIKPSLARWSVWDSMDRTNQKIYDYSDNDASLSYVDLATPMLNEEGMPDTSLFIDDGLHLNREGYDLWSRILSPVLTKAYNR